jgi:hypothetical protein
MVYYYFTVRLVAVYAKSYARLSLFFGEPEQSTILSFGCCLVVLRQCLRKRMRAGLFALGAQKYVEEISKEV